MKCKQTCTVRLPSKQNHKLIYCVLCSLEMNQHKILTGTCCGQLVFLKEPDGTIPSFAKSVNAHGKVAHSRFLHKNPIIYFAVNILLVMKIEEFLRSCNDFTTACY